MSRPVPPSVASVPAPAPQPPRQQQLELGFAVTWEAVPIPGRPDLFQIRTRAVPLGPLELVGTEQAARELGVSASTVQRLCKTGALKAHTPGLRVLRIFRTDLETYKKQRGIRNN